MKSFGKWFAEQGAQATPTPEPEEKELPEGLWMSSIGLTYSCVSCGQDSEWPADIEDFDINERANQCGRSERCCP
jgi:hypothetical protein